MLGWVPASFVALFILFFCRLVMRASVGLRIEGRLAEESMSGRNGGRLSGLVVAVAGVLPVGYLPPLCKGKGKISEIRYPGCHTPIPGQTRLADSYRVRGARPYTGTLYLIFFFKVELVPVGMAHTL